MDQSVVPPVLAQRMQELRVPWGTLAKVALPSILVQMGWHTLFLGEQQTHHWEDFSQFRSPCRWPPGPHPWAARSHNTGDSLQVWASWGSHNSLQDTAGSFCSSIALRLIRHAQPHGSSPRAVLHLIFKFWVDGSLDMPCAKRDQIRLGGPHQSRQGPHLPV